MRKQVRPPTCGSCTSATGGCMTQPASMARLLPHKERLRPARPTTQQPPHPFHHQPIRYRPDTRDTHQYRPYSRREDSFIHLQSLAGARLPSQAHLVSSLEPRYRKRDERVYFIENASRRVNGPWKTSGKGCRRAFGEAPPSSRSCRGQEAEASRWRL